MLNNVGKKTSKYIVMSYEFMVRRRTNYELRTMNYELKEERNDEDRSKVGSNDNRA